MSFLGVDPVTLIQVTAGLIGIVTLLALLFKDSLGQEGKVVFFLIIAISVSFSTVYLAASTVFDNINSETKGPVHWHADYEVWVCGQQLDLIEPQGLRNKIGTPLLHEHNDGRIHVEGTLMRLSDASLGRFFKVIGGQLSNDKLVFPTEDGILVQKTSEDLCEGKPSTLRVYVNGNRVMDPASYIIAPYYFVPPGDCIIVEFGPGEPDTTLRICESWRAKGWNYDNYEMLRGEISG